MLNELFGLLERDSHGRWCFKSLSQDASMFDRVMESLNAARATQPATTPSEPPTFRTTKEAMEYAARHAIPTVIPVTATPPDVTERARRAAEKLLANAGCVLRQEDGNYEDVVQLGDYATGVIAAEFERGEIK